MSLHTHTHMHTDMHTHTHMHTDTHTHTPPVESETSARLEPPRGFIPDREAQAELSHPENHEARSPPT